MSLKRKSSTKQTRSWKQRNPLRYAYQTLKDNAKRRGKEFALTIDEFAQFCYRYKYLGKKGRESDGYGVDRRDESKGYTLDNMCIKRNGNNTKKFKLYEWRTKQAQVVTYEEDESENPF